MRRLPPLSPSLPLLTHVAPATCTPCSKGTWTPDSGQSACRVCGGGQYQSTEGQFACAICSPGTYIADGGGGYTWTGSAVAFTASGVGTAASAHDSASDCSVCPAGKFTDNGQTSTCASCPAGKHLSDNAGSAASHNEASDCANCAAGKYAVMSSATCTDCPTGRYLTTAGTSEADCLACPRGTSNPSIGLDEDCPACDAGKYADTTGLSTCANCGLGKYLPVVTSSTRSVQIFAHDDESDCDMCAAGKISTVGQAACTDCPAGQTAAVNRQICVTCGPGTYAPSPGSGACDPCSAGKFSTTGGASCDVCLSGKFTAGTGQVECEDCEPGYYSSTLSDPDDPDSAPLSFIISCSICIAGKYSTAATGATGCEDCAVGKYSASDGAFVSCNNCIANTYQANTGEQTCEYCSPGKSAGIGSTVCSTCPGVITVTNGCIICDPGQYAGAEACTECYGGSYSSGGASLSCQPCAAGQFSVFSATGLECSGKCDDCQYCPAGKFSGFSSPTCTSCPKGKISTNGASACEECAAGKFAGSEPNPGSTVCDTCAAGKYAAASSSTCTDCVGGKTSGPGASSCTPCDAGKYSSVDTSLATCSTCAVGKYANLAGMGSCVSCPSGKYADSSSDGTGCESCAPGKYSSGGATDCSQCAAGKSSLLASYICFDCSAGKFSAAGDVACTTCLAGKFSSFSSSMECSVCSPGYYCAAGSTTAEQEKCGEAGIASDSGANVYCVEGAVEPIDTTNGLVETGFYSVPDYLDADVRTGQAECPASYFCFQGNKIPFLEWTTTCSTDSAAVSVDVTEALESDASTDVHLFTAVKNSLIGDAGLTLLATSYTPFSLVDNSPDNLCPLELGSLAFTAGSGMLKINGPIDYENCKDGVTVGVRAVGTFSGCEKGSKLSDCNTQESETCLIDLKIRNLNEPPYWIAPQITEDTEACYMSGYELDGSTIVFAVDEKTSEFTEFGANLEDCVGDPDESETITFSIKQDGSAGAALFNVRDCGGRLFVKEGASLEYVCGAGSAEFACDETDVNTYSVVVVASDSVGLEAEMTIKVKLNNVNDAPYFDPSITTTFTVDETLEKGTAIYPVVTFAIDKDRQRLTYTIDNQGGEEVLVLTPDGAIATNKMFDYEVKAAYYFKLTVTDGDPTTVPAISPLYKLQVTNINDAPYFANGVSSVEYVFPETVVGETAGSTTVNGNRVSTSLATLAADQDTNDSFAAGTLSFSITDADGGESDDFELETAGSDTFIRVKRDTDVNPFDFESAENDWFLLLHVTDDEGASPAPIGVSLSLSNVNEKPYIVGLTEVKVVESVCAANEYTVEGFDSPLNPVVNGGLVVRIQTQDPDDGQETYMSITNAVPFVMSSGRSCDSGDPKCSVFELSLTGDLNFEDTESYSVEIEISDGQKKNTGTFTVIVLDCNEEPTLVNNPADYRYIVENNETSVHGPKIDVTDADTADTFEYTLVSGSGKEIFQIDNNGAITTKDSITLNYEEMHSYSLVIQARDVTAATGSLGDSATSEAVTYTIHVIDQNEAPRFMRVDEAAFESGGPSAIRNEMFSITEASSAEDVIGEILGTDPDMNNPRVEYLRYDIVGHDYATATCSIPAGGVAVNDVGTSCCIGAEVMEIVYVDGDEDDSTGIVRLKADAGEKPFDNMGGCLLQMRITVTDAGGLTGEDETFVFFNISGTNQAPQVEDQVFGRTDADEINENPIFDKSVEPNVGDTIIAAGAIIAIDPDIGQSITYQIHNEMQDWDVQVLGVYRDKFVIDPITGAISVTEVGASSLDFEAHPVLNITILVVDDASPPLFDFANIMIVLSDVNEVPSFRSPPRLQIGELALQDDTSANIELAGDILAYDVDAADVSALTFSCAGCASSDFPFYVTTKGDNGAGAQNSGRVWLKKDAKIDFEAENSYRALITVEDTAGNTDDILVEIHILDENEPPVWTSKPAGAFAFSFAEGASGGTVIGSLSVDDPENDAIVYTLTPSSENDLGLFEVSSTGQLKTASDASFNFEDVTEYSMSIRATESGRDPAFELTETFVISVDDINDMYIEAVTPQNLLTAGGEEITFTGKEFGPLDPGLQVAIEAIYFGIDNIIYVAENCGFVTPGSNDPYVKRDNTAIKCTTVGGVGRNHEWSITVTASNTVPWTVLASIDRDLATSYDPPLVHTVVNAQGMPTSGGALVTLTGVNFGPIYKDCSSGTICENYPLIPGTSSYACNDNCKPDVFDTARSCSLAPGTACDRAPELYISDAVEVYYGPTEDYDQKYKCRDAKVIEAGTTVTCISAEGVGSGFWWKVKVGSKDPRATGGTLTDLTSQYSVPSYDYPESSYQPPSLDRAVAPPLPNNADTDSAPIQFYGDNFGIDGGEITVSYGGIDADKYTTSDCVMVVPHTSFNCSSVPGVGQGLKFKLVVSELPSEIAESNVSYVPPIVVQPEGLDSAVTGQGTLDAKTSGGQDINIFGQNFGPAGDSSEPRMFYGPVDLLWYHATGCYVSNSYNKITCTSVAGTGFGHHAQVEVGGQLSEIYGAEIAYARPSVHYFEPVWEASIPMAEGGQTPGDEWIVIHGENFGLVQHNNIDRISYGPNGVEYDPCLGPDHEHCSCNVVVDHTEIRCNTTQGSGKQHRWIIKIDGQNSTVSTTSYDRPSIDNVAGLGAVDASTDGEQEIVITGKNFGPSQEMLEKVSYGPSGQEYTASECIRTSHTEIRCLTSPGLGSDLKWLVAVDGQLSDLSDVTTNYKQPSIEGVVANTGETKGGSSHRVTGRNLGVTVANSYVEIHFDGVAIELAPGVWRTVNSEASSYLSGRADDGTDFIDFTLPEMSKLHQGKVLDVKVGHKVFNVAQKSGAVSFDYNLPAIKTIENVESDPIMSQATTDLVIRGLNFGLVDYSKIYINDVLQSFSGDKDVEGISEWSHEKIVMKYIGLSGDVYVQVGEFDSGVKSFDKSSPELWMEEPYIPDPSKFRTLGVTNDGMNNLTLAGCHFHSNVDELKIEIGGVNCPIYNGTLVNITSPDPTFCRGDGNIARTVTCNVPEGTGAANTVVLLRSGNPNFSGNGSMYVEYLPPLVDKYTPSKVDTKGGRVVITGDNFGDNVDLVSVRMGWRELEIVNNTFSHESMEVVAPAGEGTAKDITVVVDGQKFVTSKDEEIVFRYFYPIIETVTPGLLDTTGGIVDLTGVYFGRKGRANVNLVTDDGAGGYAELPYVVEVTNSTHESMSVYVGPGQGVSMIAVNVSGNVAVSDLSYKKPEVDVPAGGAVVISTTGGEEILLTGLNFGIGSDYILEIRQKSQYRDAVSVYDEEGGSNNNIFPMQFGDMPDIKEISHNGLTMVTPEGQNERDDPLELVLRVAGQESNVISFNYGRPTVVNMTMCFRDSLSLVFEDECFDYTATQEGKIVPLWSDCDPYDGLDGGCGLHTNGGYTLALYGENFGRLDAGVQSVYFGEVELEHISNNPAGSVPTSEVHYVGHNEIHIKVPPGVGTNIPVTVRVGDRKSDPTMFHYDPPFVEQVNPDRPNAVGDVITIEGVNFGPTLELAGDITILIGQIMYDEKQQNYTEWLPCPGPSFGDGENAVPFEIWQQKGTGRPYLWCQLPEVTVGPKHLMVSVAGRNVTIDRTVSDFSPKCVATYYGQQEDALYYGPILDMCGRECEIDSWKCMDSWDDIARNDTQVECQDTLHCTKYLDLHGDMKNCTVLTRQDEYCRPCPGGASCEVNSQYDEEPVSMEGYWRHDRVSSEETCGEDYEWRKHRTHCYEVTPCSPFTACVGENTCAFGYTGAKCDFCCDMMHRYVENDFGVKVRNPECWDEEGDQIKYFRQYGECAPCPSNPWMIVAILVGGATFGGTIAYIMKKNRVSLGIFSIAVDYLQILALLSATKTPWPQVILDLYTWLSAFNFNINITAPECAFELAYEDKWRMILIMPGFLFVAVLIYNYVMIFVNKMILNKHGKDIHAHTHKSFGLVVTIMYYIYLSLSMTALEVFNCSTVELEDPLTGEIVSDGKQYMSETNWVCYESGSLQVSLIPYALGALGFYSLGYPAFCAYTLLNKNNAKLAREDQILRADGKGFTKKDNPHCWEFRLRYGKLYYYFKPNKWYWVLVVLFRKFAIATISLMFRANATFQMCMIVLAIFISAVFQVKNQPYMSMAEYDDVIKEHAEALAEYTKEIDRRRGASAGEKSKKKFKLGEADAFELADSVGQYFWNYNTVETILLGSSILVNLFGLMFESQFLKTGSGGYETLANVTLATICVTLVYVFMVVWSEIVVAVFPGLNCKRVHDLLAAKKSSSGSEDITKHLHDGMDGGGMELKNLEFSSNPMFAQGEGGEDVVDAKVMVKHVKNHPDFIKLASQVDMLNQKLRDTEKRAAEYSGEAKGARFKMLVHKSKKEFDFSD